MLQEMNIFFNKINEKIKIKMIKNKKAQMENLFKILLWIVIFLIALGGLYYLARYLTG